MHAEDVCTVQSHAGSAVWLQKWPITDYLKSTDCTTELFILDFFILDF